MSGLLFGAGAVAVVVGAVMIGFGIPVNEFSFGNTLIVAGTTAVVGGLIVVALGVVVAQLQRLAEALATRAPIRSSRPLDIFESGAGSRAAALPGRVPFPPKAKSDAGGHEPLPAEPRAGSAMPADMMSGSMSGSLPADLPGEAGRSSAFAPTLRNPDETPLTVEDEVSLSPQHPMATPAADAADLSEPEQPMAPFSGDELGMPERRHEPTLDADWRPTLPSAAPAPARQPVTYFDAMWPADSKWAKNNTGPADADAKPQETKLEPQPDETGAPAPAMADEAEAPNMHDGDEPRRVAILKSGVVDGMGYTLYVDGSIEAELPQGTLRFASINELRSHLEKSA